jgi:hypothetical protein
LLKNECWLYQGSISKSGYGNISLAGKQYKPHRLVARLFLGFDLNSDKFICHKCDNPSCINPMHLFIGTAKENTQDALTKGRFSIGERHYAAKLKWHDVKAIRDLHHMGMPVAEIARKYEMGETPIRKIVQRKTWKHVKESANGRKEKVQAQETEVPG